MVPKETKCLIREMTINDYSELIRIWKLTEGVYVDEEDSYDNMITFLNRNPGLSFVAEIKGKIIGTIKGAQDGRRGYISHMAILSPYRSMGIAKALYEHTIQGLYEQGIWKCNLYVLDSNPDALTFWKHNGWDELENNFQMLQRNLRP